MKTYNYIKGNLGILGLIIMSTATVSVAGVTVGGDDTITKGETSSIGAADVAKTPANTSVVPIPYPNMGTAARKDSAARKRAVNRERKQMEAQLGAFSTSSGDKPGTRGSIKRSQTKGNATFIETVRFERKKTVTTPSTNTSNNVASPTFTIPNRLATPVPTLTTPISTRTGRLRSRHETRQRVLTR